jgi:hypothetical protein
MKAKIMAVAMRLACWKIGLDWQMKHRHLTVRKTTAVGPSTPFS